MNTPVDAAARLVAQLKEEVDRATSKEEYDRRNKQYDDILTVTAFLLQLQRLVNS